ncbi:hypothetical protein H8959_019338, partial [Pygathrix nigripes]
QYWELLQTKLPRGRRVVSRPWKVVGWGRIGQQCRERSRARGTWRGSGLRRAELRWRALEPLTEASGFLGGSRASRDPDGLSCHLGNPEAAADPGSTGRGRSRREEWGTLGKRRRPCHPRPLQRHWAAAAEPAPPFLHPTPPVWPRLAAGPRPAALVLGLVRPGPLTSPASLLPSASHVWRRRRRPGRQPVPRSPASPSGSPVGSKSSLEQPGAHGEGWTAPQGPPVSRSGRGTRADLAPWPREPEPGRRERAQVGKGTRGSPGWRALSLAPVWSARSAEAPQPRVPSQRPSQGCRIAERTSAPRGRSGPGLRRTPPPPLPRPRFQRLLGGTG